MSFFRGIEAQSIDDMLSQFTNRSSGETEDYKIMQLSAPFVVSKK